MAEEIYFAEWLRQRCMSLGISEVQLRRLLLYSESTIDKALRGDLPSSNFAAEVARVFDIPDKELTKFVAWAQRPRGSAVIAGGEGEEGAGLAERGGQVADCNLPWLAPLTPMNERLRVFLCHASEDKAAVRDLYFQLRATGFNPWLDGEDLLAGQDWNVEIRRAVRRSDVVLVSLSKRSVTKSGYIQKEIGFALDVAEEQPPGKVFLIPVRLDECEVPDRLQKWQRVDLFHPKFPSYAWPNGYLPHVWQGYDTLVRSLRVRAEEKP